MSKISQPKWFPPVTSEAPSPLKLYNSLTRSKDVFVPMKGKKVTWYSCGPTVYDAAHMGHARNYVSIDINRRILQDYFGYDILFVQNVTDIDDKIIIGARRKYLFDKYVEENDAKISKSVKDKVEAAWKTYVDENLAKFGAISDLEEFEGWAANVDVAATAIENPKFPMHLNAAKSAQKSLKNSSNDHDFWKQIEAVLVPVLDNELGHSVTDPAVFRDLPAYWESQFDNDMKALNVLPSSITTRVSEYIPEIITFVERIVSNGLAYKTEDGSVYFDTHAFENDGKHVYAKLQPWNKGSVELINEGEGSLSIKTGGKKSNNDFALWKASKPGEPAWKSPWGEGRPGWHIECSVMASEVLGEQIDIHSGGIDLAFPHHDNELAQSEACHGNLQWINYFLHTGHLHIQGQKMSKSLKNFITIQEALSKFSARQLRLAFALQQWNNQFDFKDNLAPIKTAELTFSKFFSNLKSLIKEQESEFVSKKIGKLELSLLDQLSATKSTVHECFADNLNVPGAISALLEIINKANIYLTDAGSEYRVEVLREVAIFVTKILSIIGFKTNQDGLGWSDAETESTGNAANSEDIARPFVEILSKFRDSIRSAAISKADYKAFLQACDLVRTQDLLELGVSLSDRTDGPALVKFLSSTEKSELLQAQAEKERVQAEKAARKKLLEEQAAAKLAEEKERAKIHYKDLFKQDEYSDLYSAWDEEGIPTKTKDGEDVSKSQLKKNKKIWDLHKKLWEKYNN